MQKKFFEEARKTKERMLCCRFSLGQCPKIGAVNLELNKRSDRISIPGEWERAKEIRSQSQENSWQDICLGVR
jgi:hypothetical protein